MWVPKGLVKEGLRHNSLVTAYQIIVHISELAVLLNKATRQSLEFSIVKRSPTISFPDIVNKSRSPLSYGILNFAKRCQKDADSAMSSVLTYFPGQISQPRFIQSILFQGRFGRVL